MATYRIVVEGELGDRFVATFGEMRLERAEGETWLTGEVADQAQLQGLLARVADLGLALRSFGPVLSGAEVARESDIPNPGGAPAAGAEEIR